MDFKAPNSHGENKKQIFVLRFIVFYYVLEEGGPVDHRSRRGEQKSIGLTITEAPRDQASASQARRDSLIAALSLPPHAKPRPPNLLISDLMMIVPVDKN